MTRRLLWAACVLLAAAQAQAAQAQAPAVGTSGGGAPTEGRSGGGAPTEGGSGGGAPTEGGSGVAGSGSRSESGSDPRAAFVQDVAALRACGPHVPSPADSALRRRILRDALALDPRPQPPAEARSLLAHGRRALERCTCHDSTLYAVEEFTLALHEAPWWGEAYRRLGNALPRLVRNREAGVCLELYLAAEPAAPDRDQVERRTARLLKPGPTAR